MNYGPVLPPSCPFFRIVKHGQVQHFEQAVVCRENSLGLGHLAKLAVEALNGVCRIDQPAELLRELPASTAPTLRCLILCI